MRNTIGWIFVVLWFCPKNLFWLGRPYAVNPQECEHLCETLLAGFCRIMVLPQKLVLARQTLCCKSPRVRALVRNTIDWIFVVLWFCPQISVLARQTLCCKSPRVRALVRNTIGWILLYYGSAPKLVLARQTLCLGDLARFCKSKIVGRSPVRSAALARHSTTKSPALAGQGFVVSHRHIICSGAFNNMVSI